MTPARIPGSPDPSSGVPGGGPQGFEVGEEVRTAAAAGDPVALTRLLVGIPSVNPALEAAGLGEEGIAREVADLLAGWGCAVRVEEVASGRPNVVAIIGDAGPTLLLNGHLDTVGVAGMTVPPFGGPEAAAGVIGGRGAADMKAGLAIILSAARDWAMEPGRGRLIVALTCDEEHASIGMQRLVEGGIAADAAVVTEPTSLAVMPAHKGFAWVEVAFEGRAAHGSRPEVGVDAVRHSAALLQELDVLEVTLEARPPHGLLGHGSFHAGTIRGGSAWSVYPDSCALTLERRTIPGEPGDGFLGEVAAALDRVRQRVPELEAAVRLDLVRPATEVAVDHPLVRGLLEAAEAEGVPPRVEGMTAWVDAAFLNEAGIPAVCFGPGSIAQAHSADEWVEEEEIRAGARILSRFVRSFLGGNG